MIGGLIHKLQNPKHSVFFIIALFVLNIVIEEWLCRYIGNEYCEYFYGSVYVQLLSVLVFLYILNIRLRHTKVISELSQLFLPVYTIHILLYVFLLFFYIMEKEDLIIKLLMEHFTCIILYILE